MTFLMEVPVEAGGRLVVEVRDSDLPDGLQPVGPGVVLTRAARSLEAAIDDVRPALQVMLDRLRALAPTEVEVEFGLVLTAEAGVVVAKGGGEVHFAVTLIWKANP